MIQYSRGSTTEPPTAHRENPLRTVSSWKGFCHLCAPIKTWRQLFPSCAVMPATIAELEERVRRARETQSVKCTECADARKQQQAVQAQIAAVRKKHQALCTQIRNLKQAVPEPEPVASSSGPPDQRRTRVLLAACSHERADSITMSMATKLSRHSDVHVALSPESAALKPGLLKIPVMAFTQERARTPPHTHAAARACACV